MQATTEFASTCLDATALRQLRERRQTRLQLSRMGMMGKFVDKVKSAMSAFSDISGIMPILLTLGAFFVAWHATGVLVNCTNPLVVVLSGSMEPAYYRGDLLLLHKTTKVSIGDVVVFGLPGRTVPIVHRVHRVHEDGDTRLFLTKGDNNDFDDRTLYPDGHHWVREEDAVGKVFAIIPHAGFLTILSENKPWVKFVALTLAVLWGWVSAV
ncbi:signal peptidase protein type I [Trypanosoma conorhini]|uniref:Signal peptidase complex catalytic subunit SEC11 n=1 Tax=Trypanosoma conorhini TaxID=83891 RepID=A0A3R7SB72_9TRYP|nr:signal peptidase protein type I [Trypanosoma conorhini]RNF27444.1 signal peptidase protein type I [Trypanosoma conorhini]